MGVPIRDNVGTVLRGSLCVDQGVDSEEWGLRVGSMVLKACKSKLRVLRGPRSRPPMYDNV